MQRVVGGGKQGGGAAAKIFLERRGEEKDLSVTGHAFIKIFDSIYCVYVFACYITFLEAG